MVAQVVLALGGVHRRGRLDDRLWLTTGHKNKRRIDWQTLSSDWSRSVSIRPFTWSPLTLWFRVATRGFGHGSLPIAVVVVVVVVGGTGAIVQTVVVTEFFAATIANERLATSCTSNWRSTRTEVRSSEKNPPPRATWLLPFAFGGTTKPLPSAAATHGPLPFPFGRNG